MAMLSLSEPIGRNHELLNLFSKHHLKVMHLQLVLRSVAEPPLFWAAPAPGRQGPGADSGSGSDLLGSAPAPGKKGWLQAAPAPYTKIF